MLHLTHRISTFIITVAPLLNNQFILIALLSKCFSNLSTSGSGGGCKGWLTSSPAQVHLLVDDMTTVLIEEYRVVYAVNGVLCILTTMTDVMLFGMDFPKGIMNVCMFTVTFPTALTFPYAIL